MPRKPLICNCSPQLRSWNPRTRSGGSFFAVGVALKHLIIEAKVEKLAKLKPCARNGRSWNMDSQNTGIIQEFFQLFKKHPANHSHPFIIFMRISVAFHKTPVLNYSSLHNLNITAFLYYIILLYYIYINNIINNMNHVLDRRPSGLTCDGVRVVVPRFLRHVEDFGNHCSSPAG